MHRSDRVRKTTPVRSLRAPTLPINLPGRGDASLSFHQPRSNGHRRAFRKPPFSRQEASVDRHLQDMDASFPSHRSAPSSVLRQGFSQSFAAKAPLGHFALEGEPSKLTKHPPQKEQLDDDKLELDKLELESCTQRGQLREALEAMHQAVHSLVAKLDEQNELTSNNNNNNDNNNNNNTNNTTNTNNNNNNDDNNYSNNKSSRESGLNSFDLDNDNPESEPDLDSSLGSPSPTLGVESSLDQQGAAKSLQMIGQQQTMTIGISLGSLIRQKQDSQKGMQIGTAWDPSLVQNKPEKRVSFDEANLAHLRQNKGQNNNFQPDKLGRRTERQKLPAQNNRMTTAQTCWNNFQQANWQQQPATIWEKKLQHEECTTNNLHSEEGTLGSLKQNASTTNWPAYQTPKHNNNTSSLGLGTKNTAAWGILVDTGAAISLAPWDFAQHIELRPLQSTLQLRSVTGEVIQAYGTRTVQLVNATFRFQVSFVIASVQHALLGMDALQQNQLSLCRNIFQQYHLVNPAGAAIQLKTQGHLLYIEACSREAGFSTCKRSSLPQEVGSLLDSKDGTLEEEVASSGGALDSSFPLENLREQQAKNTTNLGTTASQKPGAKRRKKKKPSAKQASQDRSQRSLEQQGQTTADTHLRSLEKTRIIDQLVGAAEANDNKSLSKVERQQLSLKILLALSLRNRWLLTTTRATGACSEDALGQQLRDIGLEQNKMEPNIFSGDELVAMLCQDCILIGGPEYQQECFFCELSAVASLEPPQKLAENNPIIFGSLMMEHQEASNSISLRVTESCLEQLLQRHDLEQIEPTTSLQQEELSRTASEHNIALDAHAKELYKQSVGDLGFLALACRPDLSFEVQFLTQSLTSPTTRQQMQLRKVLSYLRGTLHHGLSLHPATTKRTQEEDKHLELVSFSASSWTGACQSVSTASLFLWGVPLATSCRTACAEQQAIAELDSVKLALHIASFTKSFLQQLALEQLALPVRISLKTSSLHKELAKGKPLAMQLGLSRRNKHLQLDGQLSLSRVLPHKNLAQSLADNAPAETMLAKLRMDKETSEDGALSTVFGLGVASLFSSSSFIVGMVAAKPSQMEQLSPCQFAFPKSVSFVRTCLESLKRNFADSLATSLVSLTSISLSFLFASLTLCSKSLDRCNLSFQSLRKRVDRLSSLTLHSLSFAKGILHSLILYHWSFAIASLTLYCLSLAKDRLQRLTLQSLSLRKAYGFEPESFKEDSFDEGIEELDKSLAHNKLDRRAETNSFSTINLEQRMLAPEAEKISFQHSLTRMSLSLKMCLRIFPLGIFQLVCAALLVETSSFKIIFPDQSLQQDQLVAAYLDKNFAQQNFPPESLQPDELTLACLLSPTRAMQLESLQQKKPYNKSFSQLDRQISLSLSLFSFDSCSNISFEHRALHCAALLFRNRFSRNQLPDRSSQSFQLTKQQLTGQQLTGQQLSLGFVSGGVSARASTTPLQLTALTWISLSLAFRAWLNSASQRACRRRLAKSKCTASLSTIASASACPTLAHKTTRSLKTTSFRRIASTRASSTSAFTTTSSLRTTSFSRSASMRALQSTSFRTTLFWISFCFTNFFFNNSFAACPLGPFHGHLGQANLSLDQLQDHSFIQKNKKKKQQLSEAVPDRELAQLQLDNLDKNKNNQLQSDQLQEEQVLPRKLLQLHLSQLCQQDLESAFSNQLPEEPWLASGLRTAAWPAAVQSEQPSFSKKELAEQDLTNISLEEFFPKNFGKQLSDKQLSAQQLQNKQLQKKTFQQLSLDQLSFPEQILNKELATNFAKTSLIDNLVFQNFFVDPLALQKVASEQLCETNFAKKQLAENNLDQQQLDKNNFPQREEGACKEQLLRTGFPEASLDQQLFSNRLVQQSGAKAASRQELLHRELLPQQLADKTFDKKTLAISLPTRPSARQLEKNQLEEENLTENSFEALCFSSLKALCLPSFPDAACKEELLPEQLLHQQQLLSRTFSQDSFSTSSFPEQSFNLETFQPDSFTASSLLDKSFRPGTFLTAAWQTEPSDRQLQKQQLDRRNFQTQQLGSNNFQDRSFEQNSFENNTFEKTSFQNKSLAAKTFEASSFAEPSFSKSSLTTSSSRQSFAKKLAETNFAQKSFEENFAAKSFEQNLAEKSFARGSFAEKNLLRDTFAEYSFHKSSFARSSFHTTSLRESSLAENSFTRSTSASSSFLQRSLETKSFETKSFEKKSFDQTTLDNKGFEEQSFAKQSFTNQSFDKKSFHKRSLQESSLAESSFNRSTFALSSFLATSFEKSFDTTSFHKKSFDKKSFAKKSFTEPNLEEDSFDDSSFTEESFEESSFAQSSLKASSSLSSLEQSSLVANSFASFLHSSFRSLSFLSKTSFRQLSFSAQTFRDESFSSRTSFTSELSKLQRTTLTTELRKPSLRTLLGGSLAILSWEGASYSTSQRGSAKQCFPILELHLTLACMAQGCLSFQKGVACLKLSRAGIL